MRTIYIADDGTKFDDGIACANYEQECKKRDLENYSTLPLMNFDINKFSFYVYNDIYHEEEQVTKEDFCKAINEWLFEGTDDYRYYGYYTGCVRCGEVCLDFISYSREGFIEVNCIVTDNEEKSSLSTLTHYKELYTVSIEKTEVPVNQYNEEMLYNTIKHILECAEEKKKEFLWFQDGETVEDKLNKELNIF